MKERVVEKRNSERSHCTVSSCRYKGPEPRRNTVGRMGGERDTALHNTLEYSSADHADIDPHVTDSLVELGHGLAVLTPL